MGHSTKSVTRPPNAMRIILFVIGGAAAGFLYYRFVGCRTGACPLTGNPFIATLYGAALGFLLSRP